MAHDRRSGGNANACKETSADCLLDLLWLPPELFVAEAKREERVPYVANGPDWQTKAGVDMGLHGVIGPVTDLGEADVARRSSALRGANDDSAESGSERYVFARLRYQTARATDEIGRARHDPVASLRLCAIESIVGAFE
jgi:hypothetical protein